VTNPLQGVRILITRSKRDSESLRERLERLGASVLELPAITIEPVEDVGPLDGRLHALDCYQWVVFASRNAANVFVQRVDALKIPIKSLNHARIGAVGPATAAILSTHGLSVDCLPEEHNAAGLSRALIRQGVAGTRVLIPCGDLSRKDLCDALKHAGAAVDDVIVYRTVMPEDGEVDVEATLRQGPIDVIAFASPSAVENLAQMMGDNDLAVSSLVCIGPATADALVSRGFQPARVAERHSIEGLVQAICDVEKEDRI